MLFILLIVMTGIWTIYSKFLQDKDSAQKEFADEQEFLDFLEKQLGQDESHELEAVFYDEDGHFHSDEVNNTEMDALNMDALDFELESLQHGKLKLSDYKGKKVFINFWTTWCPPCKEEMPHLNEYYKEYAKEHNVEILAINITDEEFSVSDVKKFADRQNIEFPILLDEKGKVSIDYKVLTVPTSFIVNEEGKIIEKITGPVTNDILLAKFDQ